MKKLGLLLLLITMGLSSSLGQPAENPAFEVASVKLSKPDLIHYQISAHQPIGDLFTATNATVEQLIAMAYNIADWRLLGAPAWLKSERYDIIAKPERPANRDEIYFMVRTLLAERFKLAMHTEQNELRLYSLVLEKTGTKIQVNENGGPPRVGHSRPGYAVFQNVPMSRLTNFLSIETGRAVVDKTGLAGNYDFTLKFVPSRGTPNSDGLSGPTIFEAVKEQLGMKLEPGRGPVSLFLIDHIERPSEN